jgi:FtsP/CotA-like multicopper oxidase with cupredoxin domain
MVPRALRLSISILLVVTAVCLGNAELNAAVRLTGRTLSTSIPPVSNPCSRFTAGSVVQPPPSLSSSLGVLRVSFSYQTTTDSNNRQLFCFMTPSGMQNPTLQVNPGDRLIVKITNNTPVGTNPMVLNPPNCGVNTMTTASVNIHFHGVNISPACGWDEVIKTIVNPGQTFQYNFVFPKNEPPGLYWYHPHIHGLVENALLGGASGIIIVGGIANLQPAVAGLPQQLLVIRDQSQIQGLPEGEAGCSNGVPFQDITVNDVPIDSNQAVPGGSVTFTPAVLDVSAGEKQFWRVSNSSADAILDIRAQYDGVVQTLQLASIDGVPVNSQDGSKIGSLIPVTHFRMPPASRIEFVITTPTATVGLAQFITTSIATGQNGDCDPTRPILNMVVAGSAQSKLNARHVATRPPTSEATGQRFAGLDTAVVAASRLIFFDDNPSTSQFFMAVQGVPEAVFDPNAPPAISATQGTVEQWTVENHTLENHEFHIHQIHFLVESQNNFETNGQTQAPAVTSQYLDTVEVPAWDGNPNHPYPNVVLKIDFRGPDVGMFVFHCHITNHEDRGMMNIIQVSLPVVSSSNPNRRALATKSRLRPAVKTTAAVAVPRAFRSSE